ncbi:MAG: ATP-binding cassette domain-containing protein [Eubacteriales bacterium]|nr:ATP-binding cassette domain-containing protein [Eubacteriales bacterium]
MIQGRNINISRIRDDTPLVCDLSFTLNDGEKAVIIGEEGNGKSTLLRFIVDPTSIDGYVTYSGDMLLNGSKLGYLPQTLPQSDRDVLVSEYLNANGANQRKLAQLLDEVCLPADMLFQTRRMDTLSGGEKVKLQLVRVLLDEPDVLLLDEPTNDLDLGTLFWLEDFLCQCEQAVLFVSHDEMLIEKVAMMVIHLEQTPSKKECVNTVAHLPYTDYMEARRRAFDKQTQIARKEKSQFDAKMERFRQLFERVQFEQRTISRGDPSGGRLLKKKMHTIKSMGARFEKEKEKLTKLPVMEQPIFLTLPEVSIPRTKEIMRLDIDKLTVGERVLSKNIHLEVFGGEHIGIIGDNGVGKTTLLRRVDEELKKLNRLSHFYMPQDYMEKLPSDMTAVDFLAPNADKAAVTQARTTLGSVKFMREEMTCPVSRLSGGQRAKLLFLKFALERYSVLVLDEPTRNLSPLSNPVIRNILEDYDGAIISVSHDRKYLAQVCDKLFRLTKDGLEQQ